MSEATQRTYEELADRYDRQREPRQRDIFLVLAADMAYGDGRGDDAERLCGRLLQLSPHHLLRPFPSFAAALQSADIRAYLIDLRLQFSPEQAENLLQGLRNRGGGPGEGAEAPVYRFRDEPAARQVGSPPPKPSDLHAPYGAAPRTGRPVSKSPYDVPTVPKEPPAQSARAGGWFTVLLFVLMLALVLGLLGWTLVKPFLELF